MKSFASILIFLFFSIAAYCQTTPTTEAAIRRLKEDIPVLMKKSNVAGLSIALIRDGKLVWSQGFGVTNSGTHKLVNNKTVFECNSLSKPVFAYAIMQLVDEGKLDIDMPVARYMDTSMFFSKDARFKQVTARMLLSNSSGITKISPKEIAFHFSPKEKWEYQPVGWIILSKIVEKISGQPIEVYMSDKILKPLGMNSSSFTWLASYDSLLAYEHNWQGQVVGGLQHWEHGIACCSLESTPEDYAKFLSAIMEGKLLSPKSKDLMLQSQIQVNDKYPSITWGVGVGLETHDSEKSIWHWGHGTNCKDYFTADLKSKNAVVFFANSENGLFFTKEILADALGGTHLATDFLAYERHDSPSWLSLQEIIANGAKSYLANSKAELAEEDMNNIGYKLIEANKINDAVSIFKTNVARYPKSYNAWDSYGEALLKNGNKAEAITAYKKSVELNPDSESGKKALAELLK